MGYSIFLQQQLWLELSGNYLFLQDSDGYNGLLRPAKNELKSEFSAKFFQNSQGDYKGAWWYMSSDSDLELVIKAIDEDTYDELKNGDFDQ